MDCPKCSAANPDGAKFCKSCGENLAAAVAAPAETAAAPKRTTRRVTKPAAAEVTPAPVVESPTTEVATPAKAPRKRTPKAAAVETAEAAPVAAPAVAEVPAEKKPARKKAAPAAKPAAAVVVEPIAVPPESRSKTPLIIGVLVALALGVGGLLMMKHRAAEPEAKTEAAVIPAAEPAATPAPVTEQKAAETPAPTAVTPAKEPAATKPAPVESRSGQSKKQVGGSLPPVQSTTAPAANDWHQALKNNLQECARMGFFEKVACTEKARWKYCAPNRWGTVPECPQSAPTNGG